MGFFDKLFGKKGKKVCAPLTGELVKLSEVSDPTFGEGILGKGVAIKPENGEVYAPFDGEVVFIATTKHAISLQSADGIELLVHVGLDTVKLDGACFDVKVENGQQIKKGDLLMVADLAKIKEAGYDTITPVVVCNTDAYKSVEGINEGRKVNHGEEVLQVLD